MTTRLEKFSSVARQALTLAQEEAPFFGRSSLETEHILLGIVRCPESHGARILTALGVSLSHVRFRIEQVAGRGDELVPGADDIDLSPHAKKVVEFAAEEVHRMGQFYITTAHLLLGLLRENEGIAGHVLEGENVTLERVRAEFLGLLEATPNSEENEPVTEMSSQELIDWHIARARKRIQEAEEIIARLMELRERIGGRSLR